MTIRKYYQQLYVNNFDNLVKQADSLKHTDHQDWLKKKQKVFIALCQWTEFIKKIQDGLTSKSC